MNDRTRRNQWVAEVFRTPRLSAEVKVFLLFLERYYMKPDGEVREPREALAETFECHPRKITAKFNMAISGGVIEQTVRGGKGRIATYRTTLPGGPQGASTRHPMERRQGASTRPPNDCLGAADYHPEAGSQGADTRHPEGAQGASTRHPEGAPSIGTARAHSKTADRSSRAAHAEDDDSRASTVVVAPFDEEPKKPSLRSQTAERSSAARVPARVEDDVFAEFWAAYPRRVGKGAARKAWAKAIKNGADPQEVILGARRYSTDPRRAQADIKYTAHPATWLNAERWSDEDQPAQPVEATGTRRARQAIEAGRQLQDMLDRGEIQL